MSSVISVGTAVPNFAFGPEDICAAGQKWLQNSTDEKLLFERFVSSSQTKRRHFVRPLHEMLEFSSNRERSIIFEEEGTPLGVKSASSALVQAKVDPTEIDTFIFTSCSCPAIPSIDALIIQSLGLRSDVSRVPLYQHGCAGGVIGLALADKFAKLGGNVLLTSVELCSIGFFPGDHSPGHLVGSAIFGDGSASVVVSPEKGKLSFVDSQSILTRNSRHMMGYDIQDDGAHLKLDKELPSFLAREVPPLVPAFLKRNGIELRDVDWWLFHPGGTKVLSCLEEVFGIPRERAIWARDVLQNFGNLSSASVLFVTSEFLSSGVAKSRELVLMVGVGPGLTVELVLFRVE